MEVRVGRMAAVPPRRAWLPRLLRSTSARVAGLHAALLVASAAALGGFFWWNTAGYLNRQTDQSVRTDIVLMAARYRDGGLPALVRAIELRLLEDVDDEAIYLLADPRGRVLAGNLDRWPVGLPDESEWYEVPLSRGGSRTIGRIFLLDLPDDGRLLIGRDVSSRLRLRELVGNAMLYGTALALAFAGFGALLVRQVLLRRIEPMVRTATSIGLGDLTLRVPRSGAGDEFDSLAETLNGMLDRIALLMEGVRDVSNAIAHDLRTPITRLRGRLEEALSEAADPVQLRTAIERGIAELDGITNIFQALLRIAEIEAGARRSAFATIDLARLLSDAADLYSALAEAREIWFRTEIPPVLPVFADADLLVQAVANLLDNALKFVPEGGQVTLSAERVGDSFAITVADTGPGIDAAELEKVTERFYRSESSRAAPGSGLGLSLVEAVAHLHGGSVSLKNRTSGGLVATLTIAASGATTPAMSGVLA